MWSVFLNVLLEMYNIIWVIWLPVTEVGDLFASNRRVKEFLNNGIRNQVFPFFCVTRPLKWQIPHSLQHFNNVIKHPGVSLSFYTAIFSMLAFHSFTKEKEELNQHLYSFLLQ